MAASHVNDRLNDLLIDLGKSLLQYSQEAWPWSGKSGAGDVRPTLDRLAEEQRQSVRELFESLDISGHAVDFGVFPDEYTSLHYVSVEYLLDQLAVNSAAVVEECKSVKADVSDDADAVSLVEQIQSREETAVREIEALKSMTAPTAQ